MTSKYHLHRDGYIIEMPIHYDPEKITAEDMVHDGQIRKISEGCDDWDDAIDEAIANAAERGDRSAILAAIGLDLDEVGHYVDVCAEDSWGSECTEEECDEMNERLDAWLDAHPLPGCTFEVRAPRSGEAAGLYHEGPDGDLQILGYSISGPDAVSDHINDGFNAICGGWTPDDDEDDDQ